MLDSIQNQLTKNIQVYGSSPMANYWIKVPKEEALVLLHILRNYKTCKVSIEIPNDVINSMSQSELDEYVKASIAKKAVKFFTESNDVIELEVTPKAPESKRINGIIHVITNEPILEV